MDSKDNLHATLSPQDQLSEMISEFYESATDLCCRQTSNR